MPDVVAKELSEQPCHLLSLLLKAQCDLNLAKRVSKKIYGIASIGTKKALALSKCQISCEQASQVSVANAAMREAAAERVALGLYVPPAAATQPK